MLKKFNFYDFIPQAMNMLQVIKDTIPFVRKHKLWLGFFEHKWITFFTIIISMLFSWYVVCDLGDFFFSANEVALVESDVLGELGGISETVKEEGKDALFSGGTKYLLLILLEVIIFYFSVRTLAILLNKNNIPTIKDFVKAEKRMIILMGWNFGKGIVAQILISIVLSLVGFSNLTGTAMFFVYAYFIGYALLDNYNEQFGNKIKESEKIIRQHLGAATALGLVVTGLLYIPLIGPLLTPILGGVAASIYGHRFSIEGEEEWVTFEAFS